jgi:hypothetical protein
MRRLAGRLSLTSVTICFALARAASGANAIQVGAVTTDPSTVCCLGVVLPILAGDDNYDATVGVAYREQGESTWHPALPLLRVRPDTLGTETPPSTYGLPNPGEGFAGSIFGLSAGTTYEVRLTVADPDGGGAVLTTTAATRAPPRDTPQNSRPVAVATNAQLTAALGNAQPGDVIELVPGTYTAALVVTADGTDTNPIIVRGADRDSVIIDASGRTYGADLRGDHVSLENITVSGSQWGARTTGVGISVTRSRFTSITYGIDGRAATNRFLYLCDNVLEGPHAWPDVSSATWDTEGIVVSGQGHTICHNTLSGFGDALGLRQNSGGHNIAIDFYGNEVLWTGDDGMELDYAFRNVRAFGNRVTNGGMGASFQPVWGGPVYVFKNVFVNMAHSPYKLNNEPTGVYILNNTSLRTQGDGNYGAQAWPQLGYQLSGHWSYVANFQFKNNIAIGTSGPARFTSDLKLATFDYNGWSPDGTFVLYDSYANLADAQARSPYEQHSRILSDPIFSQAIVLPPTYTTKMAPQSVELDAGSNAIDAGDLLPNVNDQFRGAAPDLGAWEKGAPAPQFGVRAVAVRPKPPTSLHVD